jgi:hypothetical protein
LMNKTTQRAVKYYVLPCNIATEQAKFCGE